jgi:hypothetical protein
MKKYLIKGLLTLFVGGFVTSCADDDVNYIPIEQQKATAYAEAFKDLIGGEVAPDHDWGFTQSPLYDEDEIAAIRAMTRNDGIDGAINVNGNMWTECPGVKIVDGVEVEVNAIFNYVNYTRAEMDQIGHLYDTKAPKNLNGYFVTQVRSGNNNYSDNTYPLTYKQDGGTLTNVGQYMNHLQIAFNQNPSMADLNNADNNNSHDNISGWQHINNFNASANINWGNPESAANGNTKVENKGAYDFAYHSSYDEQYHNKWILVDGANISSDPYYANFYYVCFDFESRPTNNSTFISYTGINGSGQWQTGYNAELPGTYFTVDEITKELTELPDGTKISDIKDITITRYLNGDKMVKGDNKYTDWIIRITKGAPSASGGGQSSSSVSNRTDLMERHKLIAQGRIFCEDLGTNAQRMTKSDIDFNDAVFDAKIWRLGQYNYSYVNGQLVSSDRHYNQGAYTNGIDAYGEDAGTYKYVAEILLLAAGGTVPLNIGGICPGSFEIHDKFGTGNNRNIAHTTIINTVGEPSRQYFTTTVATDVCNAVKAEIDITSLVKAKIKAELDKGKELKDIAIGLDIIPIEVQWTREDKSEAVGEISAEYGQAPQKLRVDLGTRWVYERVPIIIKEGDQTTGPYRDFDSYAINKTPEFWKTENIDWDLLYPNIPEGMTASVDYDEVKIPGTTTTTTTTELIVWEGEQVYASTTSQYSITLYNTTFAAGNKLRIYGSSGSGEITINDSNSQVIIQRNLDFSQSGYVDITLDETQATKLSNGPSLLITGANFTITKLAKVATTVQ